MIKNYISIFILIILACLMDEKGNTIFASSEERFSKNKNDLGIPRKTIVYFRIFSKYPNKHMLEIYWI